MSIFHLAIPSHDLDLSKEFYRTAFGAKIGREYPNYVVFDFFGHQVVTHLDEEANSQEVTMYPRHFGLILEDREAFDEIYASCKQHNVPIFKDLFERHQKSQGWHFSFFVTDPSNNLIELKYYVNPNDIFN